MRVPFSFSFFVYGFVPISFKDAPLYFTVFNTSPLSSLYFLINMLFVFFYLLYASLDRLQRYYVLRSYLFSIYYSPSPLLTFLRTPPIPNFQVYDDAHATSPAPSFFPPTSLFALFPKEFRLFSTPKFQFLFPCRFHGTLFSF